MTERTRNRRERRLPMAILHALSIPLSIAVSLLAWLPAELSAQIPAPSEQPVIEDLGNHRYRVGNIVVDRAQGSFSVPGLVIDLGVATAPLEFLAITKGGPKGYESLLELDANAFEYNLACILIGLSQDNAVLPRHRFDPQPVAGDPVALWVSWSSNRTAVRKEVGELLQMAGRDTAPDDWVYVGSYFHPDGSYAAESIGLLVGFVHDPESIIQHRSGLALGNYGAVTYRQSAGPPPGATIQLTVKNLPE